MIGNGRVELSWLIITVAIVLCLAGYGTYALYNPQASVAGAGGGRGPQPSGTPGPNTLQVQVIAQQWQFTYRFPQYGDVETFALALPAHRNIEFQADVARRRAFILGISAGCQGRRGSRCEQHCLRNDARPVDVQHPVRGAVRSVARRHGCHRKRAEPAGFARWITAQRLHNAPATHFLPPYAHSYFPEPTGRAG